MYLRLWMHVPSRLQVEMVHPLPNERYIVVVLFFRIGTSNWIFYLNRNAITQEVNLMYYRSEMEHRRCTFIHFKLHLRTSKNVARCTSAYNMYILSTKFWCTYSKKKYDTYGSVSTSVNPQFLKYHMKWPHILHRCSSQYALCLHCWKNQKDTTKSII